MECDFHLEHITDNFHTFNEAKAHTLVPDEGVSRLRWKNRKSEKEVILDVIIPVRGLIISCTVAVQLNADM